MAFTLLAVVGPWIAPYDPYAISLSERLAPPSAAHWFGADALGRDILSRLLVGARISMSVGILIGVIALLVGVPIGIVAGYKGSLIDSVLMRLMDGLLAMPGLLLAIAIVAVLGPGLRNALIAISIVVIPAFARVARGSTLKAKELLYVESARATGVSVGRIMYRHIFPNILSPLIVIFSIRVAAGLLTISSLGFLGLGAQPPTPEWGAMLSEGRPYLTAAPHVTTLPGLAIMVLVLGFLLIGDGFRDVLDPRLPDGLSPTSEADLQSP